MIPRVAQRGHSFAGAGAYYLHDKQANTNDRVAWTYTHNLPTMDADKGIRYMAYTAKNADFIKHQSQDVSNAGRKATAGSVYSFSLSWHPEQDPHKSTMQNEALKVLAQLGLADHEAVIVAHNDEPHPHVHVISNLVHPETGRTAVVSYDYLTTSRLAEERERRDGKIYCEQRVENNEKRRTQAKENRQLALVKHKERKLEMADTIQALYTQSDSPKAFQAALDDQGFALAQGDRRGFVLVDHEGNIHSLSRQLKGQRAKDIRARLNSLENLPIAEQISENRKYFMRDQYETDRQKQIVDDAIESDKARNQKKETSGKSQTEVNTRQMLKPSIALEPSNFSKSGKKPERTKVERSFAEELDEQRMEDNKRDLSIDEKRKQLEESYDLTSIQERIDVLNARLGKTFLGATRNQIADEISNLNKTKENIEIRMKEQGFERDKFTNGLKPNPNRDKHEPNSMIDEPTEMNKRRDEIREAYKRRLSNKKDKGKNRGLQL